MSTNPFGKVEINGELSDVSKLLTNGIANEFENYIRKELVERTTPIIDKLAKQLAQNIAVNVKAYTMQHYAHGTTEIKVILNIDKQQVHTEIQD
jgi:DNA helicase IV